MFQMHGMENLDLGMGDPTGMTTLTPITSSHHQMENPHQLHGSYHMMSHHHHGGSLSGHTPGQIINRIFHIKFDS